MAGIVTSQVTELQDPQLRAIGERLVQTVKLAAEKAVAHEAEPNVYPLPSDPNALEHILLGRFRQLSPDKRQAALPTVMTSVRAAPSQRAQVYRDLANVNLQAATAVETQVAGRPAPVQFSPEYAGRFVATGLSGPPIKIPGAGSLDLRLHLLRCIEETSEPGADSISLAGTTIDAVGQTAPIASFGVGEFHSGNNHDFLPSRTFAQFDLEASTATINGQQVKVTFPKSFFVTVVLAERDEGGLSQFMQQLLDRLQSEATKALTTALGAAIGAAIGSGAPLVGTLIGTAVGAMVGWAVGEIFDWFKDVWKDDIFQPVTLSIEIPDRFARWPGGANVSPEGFIYWKGHGGEYHLHYHWRIRDSQSDKGDALTTTSVAIAAWGANRLDIFGRSLEDDVAHRAYDSGWYGWDSVHGVVTAAPGAVSWGPNRIDIVVRAIDNGVQHRAWEGKWYPWEQLGGSVTSSPALCSWAPNRLDLFVRGEDQAIWHRAWAGNGWTGWDSIGGSLISAPAAVSWGPGRIDVVAIGGDKALWHTAYDGSGWSGWTSLGGELTSAPAICSWAPNRLDVFARGTNQAIWHRAWVGNTWTGWDSIGGSLTSAPAAVSWGPGRIDVVARGQDKAVWHTAYDGNGWSKWTSLGGALV